MIRINYKFIILMVMAYIFAYIQGGNLPYTLFYTFALTLVASFILSIIYLINIKISVSLPEREYYCGINETLVISIKNRSIFFIPYIIIKNNALQSLFPHYSGEIFSLRYGEEVDLKYNMNFSIRGVYNLGSFIVWVRDIFGVVDLKRKEDKNKIIKVYPKIYSIEEKIFKGNDIFKNTFRSKSSIEDTYSARDMRRYQEGDSLKRINWKVSAKQQELYIKNYETVSGEEFALFLDMNEANYTLDSKGIKEEMMIDFALSLISTMTDRAVEMKLFLNNKLGTSFNIEEKEDFQKIREFFLAEKSNGKNNIIDFMQRNINKLHTKSGVGIITARVSETLVNYIIESKEKGYGMVLFIAEENEVSDEYKDILKRLDIHCYNIKSLLKGEQEEDIAFEEVVTR